MLKYKLFSVIVSALMLSVSLHAPLTAQTRLVELDIVGSHSSDDINGLDYKLLFNSTYQFTVSAQNTDTANGATLGFLFYSPDGSMTNADVSIPILLPSWGDPSVWTLGGALSNVTLIGDGVLPDQYLTGGAAFVGQGFHQLTPEPIFTFDVTFGIDAGVFCIDSGFFPPAGAWVFSAPSVGEEAPDWVAGSGDGAVGGTRTNALCLTVFAPPDDPPVFTQCANSGSDSYCNSTVISVQAVDPEGVSPLAFSVSHNGAGTASVSATTGNGSYTPAAGDVGNTVEIIVTATESDGPSSDCVITRGVTSSLPTITCPGDFLVTTGSTSTSGVALRNDDDANCESFAFSLVSVTPAPIGTVSVSSSDGRISFSADANEPIGQLYTICIRLVSGGDIVECCVTATVTEGCCVVAGDANHDGALTIGDVVTVLHNIFQLGSGFVCQDEADFNGDNEINIQDVVLPLSYIFRAGAPAVCGTTGS